MNKVGKGLEQRNSDKPILKNISINHRQESDIDVGKNIMETAK